MVPEIDILITNAGGPPPGEFRDWRREDWIKAVDSNMIGPIELPRQTIDGMIARKFGRIVNITSSAVKSPIAFLGLSNGARAGLTGFVAGLSRQVGMHNVTINNLLPGNQATDRLGSATEAIIKSSGKIAAEVERWILQQLPAARLGLGRRFRIGLRIPTFRELGIHHGAEPATWWGAPIRAYWGRNG